MTRLSLRVQRLLILLATVLAIALTARLGLWQLDRAAEKKALHSAVLARGLQSTLGGPDLAASANLAAEQLHRTVRLRGHWLSEHTVFLENRSMNGRVGFFVVTPFQVAGRDELILVQRGWGPRDARDRSLLPQVLTPSGVVEVFGRLTSAPSRTYELSAAEQGVIRQNLDVADLARRLGRTVLPLTVLQISESGVALDDGLLRDWPAQDVGLQKHYGYAFQWFALCALLLGLYVWFQTIRPRIQSRRSSAAR